MSSQFEDGITAAGYALPVERNLDGVQIKPIPARKARERGLEVARVLAVCLSSEDRPSSQDVPIKEEIASILLASGAAPLVWATALKRTPTTTLTTEFQQAYRLSTLYGVVQRRDLAALFTQFRRHGVEPLVVKGWAAARHYPELALRPSSDIDIGASPRDEERARGVLRDPATPDSTSIDLHLHFSELDDLSWEDLMARSQMIDLDGTPIRVLGDEDHLRLLCLHFAKHGGYRPLWLCDIAVILETGRSFDWSLLLSGDPIRARWVVVVLQLARLLLGANLGPDAPRELERPLPSWVLPAVLREWGDPWRWPGRHVGISETMRDNPLTIFHELLRRWPGPLEASYNRHAPVNGFSRFPFQTAEVITKIPGVIREIARRR